MMNEEQQPTYTIEELVELIVAEGERVTSRQIREWHRDGLLPAPTREKIPGQGKGRAPYRFPEPAPAAVATLAMERRYMKSAEDAKLWLWLEGFDYLDVDPYERLQNWLVRSWEEEIRIKVPSVPHLPNVEHVDDDRRAQIDEELDRNVLRPMTGDDEKLDEQDVYSLGEYDAYNMLLNAMLGFDAAEEGPIPIDKALPNSSPYTMSRALPVSVRRLLPKLSSEEFGAFSIPDAMGKSIPGQQVREAWDAFRIVTEIPHERLKVHSPIHAAVMGALRKMRYAMYKDDPEYMIYGLSCAFRFVSKKYPNQLRETMNAMRVLRENAGSGSSNRREQARRQP